jgi:GR25 family glycosyltransferase involved in LPS biosynthesis
MKTYIIKLSEFSNSIEWADNAYKTAKKFNWDVEYYEGFNGLHYSLEQFNLFRNPNHRKSKKSFQRPGTVGCLLSHYHLWKKSIEINESICILEHDVTVHAPFPKIEFEDVYKFVKGPETKPTYIGRWWASGAGYCVTPQGASKLIDFSHSVGVMPADTMLNTGIVDLQFCEEQIVTVQTHEFSFTWNLKNA